MRYWVYINDKVTGPYDENKLVTLDGFSQETLICSEEVASKGGQEWVKASSIFEFDEVPIQEPERSVAPAPTATEDTSSIAISNQVANTMDTQVLMAKLDSLTAEMSQLHQKLDSMQTHLDRALEQNEQLARQVAVVQNSATQTPMIPLTDDPLANTITLATAHNEALVQDTTVPTGEDDPSFPDQAAPKEEELIIRSALDSIYGEKPLEKTQTETFQDLLSPKGVNTNSPEENKEVAQEPVVKEGLITTPSAEEISRDELINELTASPKEDVLDQIIKERKEEKTTQTPVSEPATNKKDGASWGAPAAAAAGAAAVVGLASLNNDRKETPQAEVTPEVPAAPEGSFSMATDKNDPSHLETVLPAEQMPADIPAVTSEPSAQAQQPQLNNLNDLKQPAVQEVVSGLPEETPLEDTVQELVPGAHLEENKEEEKEGFYDIAQPEPKPVQVSTQNETSNILTDKDLEDAFGAQAVEDISSTLTEVPENHNPNDLTEIELKAGSTYLISDFVPPAQGTDGAEITSTSTQANKKQETLIQDMLAVTNKAEKTQTLSTAGLPGDATASRVSLENTIQAKRGASLDIKTVPMVPEPGNGQRLDVDLNDDVNAQHDMKTTKKSGLAKMVIGVLVTLLLLIVAYVALGMLNMLPPAFNVFSKQQTEQPAPANEELLQDTVPPLGTEADNTQQFDEVLSRVQNLMLPNGQTLQQLVEAKHAAIDSNLISWEVADAVEPDNYAVTIKVPPENPQNFKTVYRFNYNMQDGSLDPTISDAKNLLDQAYGSL